MAESRLVREVASKSLTDMLRLASFSLRFLVPAVVAAVYPPNGISPASHQSLTFRASKF